MDIFTHSLTGFFLGRAFTKDKEFKTVVVFLVFVSIFPDLDYISRFWGVDVFLRYHRGLTHGIVFFILAPIVLSVFMRLYTGGRFVFWWGIGLMAYGIHLLMDLATQYPMRFLAPFSWKPFNWDLLFILDPYITGAILFGIYLTFKTKKHAQRAHIVTAVFLVMAMYVGTRAILKTVTGDFLQSQMNVKKYNLYPLPNDFMRWWFVMDTTSEYRTGFVDLFTRSICFQDIFDKSQKSPLIERTKKLKEVQNFLYFSRTPYPVVYRDNTGTKVVWKELSYGFLPGEHFVVVVEFNRAGAVKRAYAKIR